MRATLPPTFARAESAAGHCRRGCGGDAGASANPADAARPIRAELNRLVPADWPDGNGHGSSFSTSRRWSHGRSKKARRFGEALYP